MFSTEATMVVEPNYIAQVSQKVKFASGLGEPAYREG